MKIALSTVQNKPIFVFCKESVLNFSLHPLFLSVVGLVFLLLGLTCRKYQKETLAFLVNGSFKEAYAEILG